MKISYSSNVPTDILEILNNETKFMLKCIFICDFKNLKDKISENI